MKFLKTLKSRNGKEINFSKLGPEIEELCVEFRIKLMYIFGSYAFGKAGKLSDLDIAYLPERKFSLDKTIELISKLQNIFDEEAVDIVDLNSAPLTLIHRVLKVGRCVYAEDLRTKVEFEMRAESLYFDTEPLRREYFEVLLRRIKDGTFGYRYGTFGYR